jgi:DNA-binding MarR family transcriptional regulator
LTDHRLVPGVLETHTAALPVIPKLEPIQAAPQELELLLGEVNALTLRLRQAARLREEAGSLLSAAQGILRLLLEQGPRTVPQIARLRGTSRQNVQILVNHLGHEGLIVFATNPAHRSSALIMLTEAGQAALAAVATAQNGFASTLSSLVTQAEVRSATALLRRLRDSLGEARGAAAIAHQHKRENPDQEKRVQNTSPFTRRADEETSVSVYELPVNLL